MSGTEKHELSFDTFKIVVFVDKDDNVSVDFHEPIEQGLLLSMSWDDLREVLDFVGIHGSRCISRTSWNMRTPAKRSRRQHDEDAHPASTRHRN